MSGRRGGEAAAGTGTRALRVGMGAWLAVVLLLSGGGDRAHAQSSGDGYLFGEPRGRLTLRGGFSRASASSDLFTDVIERLTLNRSDFSGAALGAEAGVRLGSRLELSADVGYMSTRSPSSYRNFVDNSDQEIRQTTTLQRVPLMLNARLYLVDRGRSIGRLAWIPTSFTPYLGAGAGMLWHRFDQKGDFVDFNTNAVFTDAYLNEGWNPAAQALAGLDYSVSPRLSVTGDVRYLFARAPLGRDFVGFDQKLDLSGATLALGLTIRM